MMRILTAIITALVALASGTAFAGHKVFVNCSNQTGNPVTGGGNEAEYALDNANRTRDKLVAAGFDIRVSQDFNNSPSMANQWGAEIFVSIHSNAGGGHGTETLYKSSGGRVVADHMEHHLYPTIANGGVGCGSFRDRGLKKRDDLHVLNATDMYAILPEVLFHDCAAEAGFLRTANGRDVISTGLAEGVCSYFDVSCAGGPPPPQYAASFSAMDFPQTMTSGDEAVVWVEYKNDGTATWDLDNTRLGTTKPRDRASPFYKEGNWINPSRPTAADHSTYSTGVVGRFTFMLLAPEVAQSTEFTEHWGLVQEGVTWFGPPDDQVFFNVTVNPKQAPKDSDQDGHVDKAAGGDDCDDTNPNVHPGAADVCGNNVDEDCSGSDAVCPQPDAGPREDAGIQDGDGGGDEVDGGVSRDASTVIQIKDFKEGKSGSCSDWPFTLIFLLGLLAISVKLVFAAFFK